MWAVPAIARAAAGQHSGQPRSPTLRLVGVLDRLLPRLGGRALALELALALLSLGGVYLGLASEHSWTAQLWSGAAAALLLLLLRRTAPLAPFAAGAALSTVDVNLSTPLVLGAYAVGRFTGSWWVRALAGGIGCAAVLIGSQRSQSIDFVSALVQAALLLVLPAALGVWQRTREELLTALRSRAERAEAEQELLARDAVLTERNRIAGEMHDAVGHRVSLMVLQAGAIELAARDADRVEQLAAQVQGAGRLALEELRQMVGVLRAGELQESAPLGPQPGLDDLPRLVAQARQAGMLVEFSGVDESEVDFSAIDSAVSRAAYRIAQEGLTNAGKHAPGAHVHLSLQHRPGELVLVVVNGPSTHPATPVPGGGYGLLGLEERVRTLNGRFSSGPRLDGGFGVQAVLPA